MIRNLCSPAVRGPEDSIDLADWDSSSDRESNGGEGAVEAAGVVGGESSITPGLTVSPS